MPTTSLGGVMAGVGVFTGLAVALGVISSQGYSGNNKNSQAITLPPTVIPATLPKSTSPSTAVDTGSTTPSSVNGSSVASTAAGASTGASSAATPPVVTMQQTVTTTPSTTTRRYSAKSRYYPINDRDVLIIIASVIGAIIVIAAIVAIAIYRWRQNRHYGQNYGVRPPSSASGALPPVAIQENEYYSTTSSTASPTDIYFDAMKQIPLHRPPDAFMSYSEFGDDEFGPPPAMGPPHAFGNPHSYHASTMGGYHKQPPMMMESAVLEYPQAAAPYPGPYFISPPHYL